MVTQQTGDPPTYGQSIEHFVRNCFGNSWQQPYLPQFPYQYVPFTTADQSTQQCQHCGNYHTGACPAVAEIEYYENGTVKRVVYR